MRRKDKIVTMPNVKGAGFWEFYRGEYASDHQHPANVALHVIGTIAGLMLIAASFLVIPLWWALTFPVVHAVPGLIGHRLYDRNETIGDARITRTDYPLYWFIVANHLLTAHVFGRLVGLRLP